MGARVDERSMWVALKLLQALGSFGVVTWVVDHRGLGARLAGHAQVAYVFGEHRRAAAPMLPT
jgi:hypothetical protein